MVKGHISVKCKVCSNFSHNFSSAIVLNKYSVEYFRCENCGFVQTEEPYWLNESYSQAISRIDVGLVGRNIRLAKTTKAIINAFFNSNGMFIDYGGGIGLCVRLLRDAGFDFFHCDKYSENILAQGFEAESYRGRSYELLTAFEVFEHLTNPLDEIQQMLAFSKSILFTTELLPVDCPKPENWWYYGLEHGQHVSFYTLRSLKLLAEKTGLSLYSDGNSLHLLTPKKISPILLRLVIKPDIAYFINRIYKRTSLIPSDYDNNIVVRNK